MLVGEILAETKEVGFNPVRGLLIALEKRKQRLGTPAERQAAYARLSRAFAYVYGTNQDKIGVLKSDPTTRRLLFDWGDIGDGSLDEKDGVYTFSVSSHPYDRKFTILGDRKRTKRSQIILTTDTATIVTWVETNTTPPTDPPFPMVTESKRKQGVLDLLTANDITQGLSQPNFKPTIDSWFADYSPLKTKPAKT